MSTNLAPWKVAAGTTTKIRIGTAKVEMRVYNDGPGSVFVKDLKKKVTLVRPGTACDFEGTVIAVSATGADSSGKYERL
jgi:hypothetical protein